MTSARSAIGAILADFTDTRGLDAIGWTSSQLLGFLGSSTSYFALDSTLGLPRPQVCSPEMSAF